MFGSHTRLFATGRIVGAVLAVGLLASACGSSSNNTSSSAGAGVSSGASAVSSAGSAAASKALSAGSSVGSAASSAGSAASSKVASAASAVSSAVAAATGPAVVGTATNAALGTFLVDAKGMTLYMYVPDTAGVSTCYDACAVAWPPLLTNGTPTATGSADASKLSTSARKDGSAMVNYGQWPLYYFQFDKAAGDVKGQGNKSVWYVVGVDGQPIKTPAS